MIDPGLAESEVLALGGVQWRQIRRYALMNTVEGGRVNELQWQDNPEYDRELYENSEYAASCVVDNEVPLDLDDEWSEDGMDSLDTTREDTDEYEYDGAGNERYPRYRSAATHMSGRTMEALVGRFPPTFTQYGSGAAASSEEDVIRDEVMRDLERYVDLTAEQIQQQYPDYAQNLQDLLDHLDRDTCSPPKRPRMLLRARAEQPKNTCCQSLSKIRRLVVEQKRKSRKTDKAAGVSPDELKRLEEGQFDGFDGLRCTAILTAVLASYTTKGKPSGSLGRRNDEQVPMADCQRARDIVLRQKIPEPCRKVKNIEFDLALSSDYWSGTYDKVAGTIEGPAGKADFFFAEAPARGTQKTISVDMKKSFGSDEIDINGIDKITLTAQGVFWTLKVGRNDKFQVQDIKIRAQCSDPSFKTRNDKFIGVNACVIKDLRYDFKVANVIGGGTYDKIHLTLGEGKQIELGSNVAAGYTKEDAINLKEAFGKDTVDVRDIKKVALADDLGSSLISGDAWTFQGITFSASCADVPKKMQMKKFESVNQDVKHVDNAPVWTGDIVPQDWTEVV
ncbi:protein-tyrosine phosphatase [Hirsutella rhossiliensis]|uniref:Protein-tyrosine phosphatase n=1 Tax=Hirsutella rhossiliensis TaxID=111463 RepID=A0A9P8MV76_9HYPO|nr:protein-tyrosine phosphatase [Hirsutella rhossiliensis]KAH0961870.1 protein-tyrosine phosphatase [Hirsutella rhossiliensis]